MIFVATRQSRSKLHYALATNHQWHGKNKHDNDIIPSIDICTGDDLSGMSLSVSLSISIQTSDDWHGPLVAGNAGHRIVDAEDEMEVISRSRQPVVEVFVIWLVGNVNVK